MPNGIRFGQQVPQQVDPNILSILKAALTGAGRDIGGIGRGVLGQLGQGIQSPAFPFVPPVDLGKIGVSAPTQATPQPGVLPQRLPQQQIPTGTTPPSPTTPTEQPKKGMTDQQRQLLATAIQVGLPLALAGFGGERGLFAGAGLAKGFGEAATQRRKLEALKDQPVFTIDPETGQLTQTGTVPKGAKIVKKPKEPKEDETLKAIKALLGTPKITPETAGVAEAAQVRKVTERAKGKLPQGVTEEDIKFTMKKRNLTRQQVLDALK